MCMYTITNCSYANSTNFILYIINIVKEGRRWRRDGKSREKDGCLVRDWSDLFAFSFHLFIKTSNKHKIASNKSTKHTKMRKCFLLLVIIRKHQVFFFLVYFRRMLLSKTTRKVFTYVHVCDLNDIKWRQHAFVFADSKGKSCAFVRQQKSNRVNVVREGGR